MADVSGHSLTRLLKAHEQQFIDLLPQLDDAKQISTKRQILVKLLTQQRLEVRRARMLDGLLIYTYLIFLVF